MSSRRPIRSDRLRSAGGRRHPLRGWGVVLVASAALVTLLAGCSSDSDGAGSPSTTTSKATTTTGSDPTETTAAPSDTKLELTSSAFENDAAIPSTYACAADGGDAQSPPLAWSGVPKDTALLVLVIHDPDAPVPGGFTHLVTAFEPSTTSFAEAAASDGGPMAAYIPMCPPSGEHRYEFTLYAFGPDVKLPDEADKAAIDAIADQALASSTLAGTFAKP